MKFFVILLILCSFFVGINQSAHACSCAAEMDIAGDYREETSVIFSGKVSNIKEQQRTYLVTFEINESWKGIPNNISSINTMTSQSGSTCGYDFTENESYLVVAYGMWDQTPEVGICSSTVALANAHQEISYLNKQVEEKAQNPSIPDWIKKTAGWWADGIIADSEFVNALEFLILNDILVIPEAKPVKTDALPGIPNWVKDTAGWWAGGKVTDSDFVLGIQYLISKGIISLDDNSGKMIPVFFIEGNLYPVSQFHFTGKSPDCPGDHLHATSGYTVEAVLISFTDPTPGGCGLGEVTSLDLRKVSMNDDEILAWVQATGIEIPELYLE
jgi:hypothetical protein